MIVIVVEDLPMILMPIVWCVRAVAEILTVKWYRWERYMNAKIAKEESRASLAWDSHLMEKDGILRKKTICCTVIGATREDV